MTMTQRHGPTCESCSDPCDKREIPRDCTAYHDDSIKATMPPGPGDVEAMAYLRRIQHHPNELAELRAENLKLLDQVAVLKASVREWGKTCRALSSSTYGKLSWQEAQLKELRMKLLAARVSSVIRKEALVEWFEGEDLPWLNELWNVADELIRP